jgi:glutamate carboxypeptidase
MDVDAGSLARGLDAALGAAIARCQQAQPEMMALLERMVAINSYTGNREGGARTAAMLESEIAAIPGMSVRSLPSDRYAPHVCAHSEAAASPEGCIALVGHHDTVFPPGTFEGFRIDGELARGPGVVDMKGGLVVMLFALRALAESGLLARLPVRVVIVSDEEIGSPEGAEVIAAQLSGAACALTFESGRAGDAIITRRKGTGSIRLMAHGKAAHSGNHHADGANAIWAVAKAIDFAQSLTDYARGITINTGTVQGGQGRNTVPDRAEALVDLRFASRAEGEETVARLRELTATIGDSVPGTRVEVVGGIARPPLERSEANVALYREYAACARTAGLGDGEAALVGGGSDAATTAALGIPSIDGLGPRGSGFHTHDERVELATFIPKTEALVRFLAGRAQ